MILDELRAFVGAPPITGETMERARGGLLESAWKGPRGHCWGEGGWWWAITCGPIVLAIGWTSGDKRDRDIDLARAMLASKESEVVS